MRGAAAETESSGSGSGVVALPKTSLGPVLGGVAGSGPEKKALRRFRGLCSTVYREVPLGVLTLATLQCARRQHSSINGSPTVYGNSHAASVAELGKKK